MEFTAMISPFQDPNQEGRDEEEASAQEEGEPLHEVQGGRVERVEDAGGQQHGQAIHTGHGGKESTLFRHAHQLGQLGPDDRSDDQRQKEEPVPRKPPTFM